MYFGRRLTTLQAKAVRYGADASEGRYPCKMSGLELGRLIREHQPKIAVILASGYSDKAVAAVNEGFTLIRKPYSPEALGRVLNSTLSETRSVWTA